MRRVLLEEIGRTGLLERLRMLGPGADVASARTWIRRRVARDAAGRPYIDLDSVRLHYLPEGRPVDDAEALRGAILVAEEAFVSGPGFFTDGMALGPGDTVLDLGGNLGTSAILFSRLVGPAGRVYSFEPVFHELLERNVRENGLDNVEVVPCAVGSEVGEVPFSVSDYGLDARRQLDPAQGNLGTVPMTTINAFAAERELDELAFVKLDIEGGEEDALRGGRETIGRLRPMLAVASYHTDPSGDRQHPKLVALLEAWGYRVREVGEERIHAWPPDDEGSDDG